MRPPRLSGPSATWRAAALPLLDTRLILWLLVGATFVTVVRIEVLAVSLRLEHLVLLACVVGLVLQGRIRALFDVMGDRTLRLFGAFIIWSAAVAIFRSASPGTSLSMVAWLALDWLLLAVLASTADDGPQLAGVGATWAGVAGAVAIAAWVAAQMAGTSFGVTGQSEVLFGARSAFGLSFEPNLLGATMALWAFITSVVVAIFLLATFAPKLGEPIARRASQVFDFDNGTGKLRLASWEAALDDLQGYDWLFGRGANTFGLRHHDVTDPSKPAYLSNLPLHVLYETGIVGVVLLSATVVSLLTRRRLRDGRALGLLTVFLVCAAATSPFWYGTTWVLVAMAVVDRRRHDATDRAAPTDVVERAVPTPVQ